MCVHSQRLINAYLKRTVLTFDKLMSEKNTNKLISIWQQWKVFACLDINVTLPTLAFIVYMCDSFFFFIYFESLLIVSSFTRYVACAGILYVLNFQLSAIYKKRKKERSKRMRQKNKKRETRKNISLEWFANVHWRDYGVTGELHKARN